MAGEDRVTLTMHCCSMASNRCSKFLQESIPMLSRSVRYWLSSSSLILIMNCRTWRRMSGALANHLNPVTHFTEQFLVWFLLPHQHALSEVVNTTAKLLPSVFSKLQYIMLHSAARFSVPLHYRNQPHTHVCVMFLQCSHSLAKLP